MSQGQKHFLCLCLTSSWGLPVGCPLLQSCSLPQPVRVVSEVGVRYSCFACYYHLSTLAWPWPLQASSWDVGSVGYQLQSPVGELLFPRPAWGSGMGSWGDDLGWVGA